MKSLGAEFYEAPLLTPEPVADVSDFAAVRCKLSQCRALGQSCSSGKWAGIVVARGWGRIWEGIEACVLVHKGSACCGVGVGHGCTCWLSWEPPDLHHPAGKEQAGAVFRKRSWSFRLHQESATDLL